MTTRQPSDQAPLFEAELRGLLDLLAGTDLVELEVERDGLRVRIRREPTRLTASQWQAPADSAVEPAVELAEATLYGTIASPRVGVFHAGVRVGEQVEVGQAVGVVEALRMRHPVEADSPGMVDELLVRDGHAVEYGQPLVRLRLGPAT